MNTTSRTITGSIGIILGIFLVVLSFYSGLFILIYGVPILLVGVYILLNKSEDDIEQIKSMKGEHKTKILKGGRKKK